jgi:hypothetical protein
MEEFGYLGRSLKAGETFEPASDDDANILVLIGRAVRSEEVRRGPGRPRKYERRDMVAEE